MLIISAILTLFLNLSFASGEIAPSYNLIEMANKARIPLIDCPERVWADFRPYPESRYVLIQSSQNKSVTIASDGTMIEGTAQEWGSEGESYYHYDVIDGIKTVLLNVDLFPSEKYSLETLFHEGFHFAQTSRPSTSRVTKIPFDYDGRIARSMQIRHLIQAVKTKDPRELELAAYWEQWIKKNRPEDWKFNQSYDVVEGSAEYVGLRSLALTKLGCKSNEDDLNLEMIKESQAHNEVNGKDGQSYIAGFLGYILASQQGNMKAFSNTTESPVTMTLKSLTPTPEEMDENLRSKYHAGFQIYMDEAQKGIDQFTKSEHLLAIPSKFQQGAFSALGFFETEKNPSLTILPNFHALFENDSKKVTLKNVVVAEDETRELCSVGHVYLVPLKESPLNGLHESSIEISKDWQMDAEEYNGKTIWCLK